MTSAKTSHPDSAGQQPRLANRVMSWRPRSGTIPLPLWLQGCVEALLVAAAMAVLALIGPLAVYIGVGVSGAEWKDLGVWWAQSWLVLHGAPLSVHVADLSATTLGSTATPGSFHLWPLSIIALLIWLAHRAGRRLARATTARKVYLPLLGALAGYALAAAAAWAASYHEVTSAHWYSAIPIPLAVFAVGLGLGVVGHYGGWQQWWEEYLGPRVQNLGQRSRWQLSYLWACVRAATVALLGLFAGAALVFAIQLSLHWMDVVNLQQELNLGVSGALAMAGINFTLLANFIAWTMAWITGAGFGLGEGNVASLFETAVGPVPAFPLLGMVPTSTQPWMWLVLLVPLLAGALGGWWFMREGENHVDEALDVRVSHRWMSLSLSTLVFGLLLAGILWLFLTPLYFAATADLGIGRLHGLGPDPLPAALWGAALTATGGMLGYLIAPLLGETLSQILPEGLGRSRPVTRTLPEPVADAQPPATAEPAAETPKPASRFPGANSLGRLKRPRRSPSTTAQPPQSITAERELPKD